MICSEPYLLPQVKLAIFTSFCIHKVIATVLSYIDIFFICGRVGSHWQLFLHNVSPTELPNRFWWFLNQGTAYCSPIQKHQKRFGSLGGDFLYVCCIRHNFDGFPMCWGQKHHFWLYFVIVRSDFEAKPTSETCFPYPKTYTYLHIRLGKKTFSRGSILA